MQSNNIKKLGVITCTGMIAGSLLDSSIVQLSSSLATVGSITIISWIITVVGALALALVYSHLGVVDPQPGGPIAYASDVSPILGYQTASLYYHANWIGNVAIAITGVGYLSAFFPALNGAIPLTVGSIIAIWIFTCVNLLGAQWVGKTTTVGMILVAIPVAFVAIFGWFEFSPHIYAEGWRVPLNMNAILQAKEAGTAIPAAEYDSTLSYITKGLLLCIWCFFGIESASMNAGLIKNPERNVALSTVTAVVLVAILYIASCQVIAGLFPAHVIASQGAPIAFTMEHLVHAFTGSSQAANFISKGVAFVTALASFTALGAWMMLVGQSGKRAADDGYFPKAFGEEDKNGMPRKGLILASIFMTLFSVLVGTITYFKGGDDAASLYNTIIELAVPLQVIPYFYSCINLVRLEGLTTRSKRRLVIAVIALLFCFLPFYGSDKITLATAIAISTVMFLLYSRHPRHVVMKGHHVQLKD